MAACRTCGAELPAGARFCPSCGAPVDDAPPPAEMLKLATVLFADVVSSTSRAEAMHPEDVQALMADFFAVVAAEIRAEGGTLEKYVGDAVMAVFGVPTAHEDDPIRAVRAARRMLAALERWNEGRDDGVEVRIGVNTGDVLAAAGRDVGVTGDTVNVAARLEQASGAGQILVGARTARAVDGTFALRPVEPLALKGKGERVSAWVVEGELASPRDRGIPGLSAPLVGRDAELDLLRSTFERVRQERSPSLVTILADAGVGKSRLVREFVAGLDVETKVLVGRCLAYGDGVTLWPLVEILKGEAVVLENDPGEQVDAKILALVRDTIPRELAPDPTRTAAALASTLGLGGATDDPHAAYRALVAAWSALLTALAADEPVAVVVEDIHWADEAMLDVLGDLAERVEGAVFLLCTARPDLLRTRPDWGGGRRNFSSVALEPLTRDQSRALVRSLLAAEDLPARLRERILERSEGNPFFLEEIVRRLIDEGVLVLDDGRWHARAGAANVEIPDEVQGVILARIDLLGASEKRALQQAAVVGRTFWRGALASLVGDDGLDAVLRTLVRRELVVERLSSSVGGEAEFVFKHVLIRDVAYESLPRRERAVAHTRVAAWLEAVAADRSFEYAEVLAHHYDRAHAYSGDDGARQRASELYITAAVNAVGRFALAQGQRFSRRAVELAAPGDERAATYATVAGLYGTTSQGDEAWRAWCLAIEELGHDHPEFARLAAAAALVPTRWHGTMHDHPSAHELRELIDAGLAAAGEEDSQARVELLASRAFLPAMAYEQPTPEAEAAGRDALAAAERLGDPDLISTASDAAGSALLYARRYSELEKLSERRLALVDRLSAQEIGDSAAVAAWARVYLGLYREAEAAATLGVERSLRLNPGTGLHCLVWRVYARFMLGDWDGALADFGDADRAASEDPRAFPPGPYMRAFAIAGLCYELRGLRGEADRCLDYVRRFLDERPRPGLAAGVAYAARALAHAGRLAEARRLFPSVPQTDGACVVLEALCDVVAEAGDWDEAPSLLERAREDSELGGLLALPRFADRLEGRLAAAQGDVERAAALLRRSADGFARLGAPWEEAFSRLLLGELNGDADELRPALAAFERLGSVREAERAGAAVASASA